MIGKIFTLGVLYFVQGLPYGFQDKFIPMYLRSSGLSHTSLSLMKLLLLPWLCKAGFAPLIDMFWTKWFWLLISLVSLTIVSFLGIFLSTTYFWLLAVWLFFLNLFSAFQDVSVDGLAMLILQDCEMGHGNTAQVVGYKLGSLFGGGVLFWIHYYNGWSYLCLSLASLYIMSIVAFLPLYTQRLMTSSFWIPNLSEKDKTEKPINKKSPVVEETHEELMRQRRFRDPLESSSDSEKEEQRKNIEKKRKYSLHEIPKFVFATEGTVPVIFFLLFYKLGERGALSTFPIFLVDQGVSTKDIGLWSGIIGQLSSLVGSVCSGWLISRKWNLPLFLHYVLIARTVPIFIQWIIVSLWYPNNSEMFKSILFFFSASSLCALEFTAGLVTTAVFTLMMSCSLKAPPTLQATHYSVLSSIEVAGKLLFSSFAGVLIDSYGLGYTYLLFITLSLASLLILRLIR
ncbi:major facilitator superfamily domain-containing protein 3 [Parasteatoda tepidariorum]|uniref:major facilitator superfamily domain-containing protein 3 n=1 Tax=Parasteatoda tepidariorum TaxID=114398 RepID=UPI00077FBD85|nr:major facilitator superfamily domain-containing protein 3 [Parasteatoda tepidariorum]